jgi:hypothetical protein
VHAIIETPLDVATFITTAHTMVDYWLARAGLPEDLLKQEELYLAAHFTAVSDPRAQAISDSDTSVRLQLGKDGSGLCSTQYGSMAVALDPTGTLAGLGQKRASVEVF